MASQEKVNAAASARKRGRLSAEERDSLRGEWKSQSKEEMADIIARLEVKLKHSVYSAADCTNDCKPYELLQKTRDTLYNARLMYGALTDGIPESKYESIIKIQCLTRIVFARNEYSKRMLNRKSSFTGQLETDQLNESALLIQGQVRKKLAKNELSRRKNKAKDQTTTITTTPSKQQSSSSEVTIRDLPLSDDCATLVPSYRVHDVSNVVITDDEIRDKFAQLDIDNNGFLSKLEFKNFYIGIDSFGVEETSESIDKILTPYNMLGMYLFNSVKKHISWVELIALMLISFLNLP